MFKYFRKNLNNLNTFSIAQMAQFAGIKPHTIRIWEQRYGGLTPARTKGNTRFYDDVQLRRLLNIVSLQDQGFKVSELCLMSDADLFNLAAKVMEKPETDLNNGYIVAQLVRAAIDFDEAYFNHHITHSFLRFGV
ncbi:MAG TPA: MerR family transcriptional regulator, partial [Chitinophagaceae bacterium]|nr:MerR family transcriptional regulator [Chitinophagaceae bacterium]